MDLSHQCVSASSLGLVYSLFQGAVRLLDCSWFAGVFFPSVFGRVKAADDDNNIYNNNIIFNIINIE